MALSTTQKINIANVSGIYASNELNSGGLHGGVIDEKYPSFIFAVRQGLEWLYELDPADTDIPQISNYLISLCKHHARAERNITGGGAIPTVLGVSMPSPIDYIVTSDSTPFASGDGSVTLSQFIGYEIDLYRGGIIQYTTNPGDGSNWYVWDKTSGLLQIFGDAQLGEQIRIKPNS